MEVQEHEYVHIKMHRDEATDLINLLEQINNGSSNMPDWAKAAAIELVRKIRSVGL